MTLTASVALTTVVTRAVLEEFWVLKATFDTCHGNRFRWFVRCDEASYAVLAREPEIHCRVFSSEQRLRPGTFSPEFRQIIAQKMQAMEDAWQENNWGAVAFLDADLVVTKPFIDELLALPNALVLTPHHRGATLRAQSLVFGRFNAGFVLTKSSNFHEWWRSAFESDADGFMEQACLDKAPAVFETALLDQRANVGFWRRDGIIQFRPIPPDWQFLHVHLFQPVDTLYGFVQRSFALHCLEFLCQSPEHERVLEIILSLDSTGWYAPAIEQIRSLERFKRASGPVRL
jgi:hypothetical protein